MTDGDEYTIVLRLGVGDHAQLWNAAVARATISTRMTFDEVVETIGPCEDPNIGDCLAMLFDPSNLPGCRALSWSCTQLPDRVPSIATAAVSPPRRRITRFADIQRLFMSVTP